MQQFSNNRKNSSNNIMSKYQITRKQPIVMTQKRRWRPPPLLSKETPSLTQTLAAAPLRTWRCPKQARARAPKSSWKRTRGSETRSRAAFASTSRATSCSCLAAIWSPVRTAPSSSRSAPSAEARSNALSKSSNHDHFK